MPVTWIPEHLVLQIHSAHFPTGTRPSTWYGTNGGGGGGGGGNTQNTYSYIRLYIAE